MLEFNLILLLFFCVIIHIITVQSADFSQLGSWDGWDANLFGQSSSYNYDRTSRTGISAQLSEEDLARFILEAMQSNQTLDYDFGNSTEKPCEPYTPVKPVFTQNAISEIKCMEYIWEMENREKEALWAERCRTYLIIQIKKGYFPEAFFFIKPPFIFGGIGAKPKEFPHMGAVGWRAKNTTQKWVYKCGSTLISDKFLLTAAHCSKLVLSRTKDVVNSVPEVVMLGLENLETNEFDIHGTPILQEIERIIIHPLYAPPKKYNDIALIEMKTAVRFAPQVQPACLWSREDVEVPGQNVTITGWGTTESGNQSYLLQKAVVDVLESRQCDKLLQDTRNRNWHGLVESQLCAGKLEGDVDTCQGDSGGPLQTIIPTETEGKIYRIMGVTSFGIKCGVQKRPGIYTRVSTYVDWIEGIVWGKNNNFSMPTYTIDSLSKLQKEDPCAPYIPLVPDVRGLQTVSEIKCKEYMWSLKNQLLKENQREKCEARRLLATYVPEKLHNGTTMAGDGYVGHGRAAQYAEFPHMGAVGWRCKDTAKKWVFKCGSSLISDKFLLTAAHCTKLSPRFVSDIVNGDPEVVKLGVENILDDIGNEERRPKIAKIVNIIVHPEYKSPKKYNDIALLEVDQAIEFTEFIKPACIWPHKDMSLVGTKVTLTGWGETETGQPATILQAGDVEILDTHTCDSVLKPFHNRNWQGFTDKQMCAGKPGGRVDTCKGDSGGPLSIRLEGYDFISLHLVVGVTSFGIQCSVRDRPGVYTRVASYVDWIEERVWNYTSKF